MCFAKSKELYKFIGKAPKQNLEYFDLYNLKSNDIRLNLYISRKRAGKSTHVLCTEGGDIIWKRFYLFGGMSRPQSETNYALRPVCDKDAITVVIIRGTPAVIAGLDNGVFGSHLCAPKKCNVYLMSEKDSVEFLNSVCPRER